MQSNEGNIHNDKNNIIQFINNCIKNEGIINDNLLFIYYYYNKHKHEKEK